MKRILALIAGLALALSCKTATSPDPNSDATAYKNSAWNIASGEFDIIGAHKDGSVVAIDTTATSFAAMRVLFKSEPSSPGFLVWLNENGIPILAHVDGDLFVFENDTGTTIDVGIIWRSGGTEILRGVAYTEAGAHGGPLLPVSTSPKIGAASSIPWATVFRVVGRGISVGACAISIATTLASGGAGWPLTVLGCGATVLELLSDAEVIDNDIIEDSAGAIGIAASAVGCARMERIDCWDFLTNSAAAVLTVAEGQRTGSAAAIDSTRAALRQLGGDVQVTLTWNNTSDLDLWVTDPAGELIYYAHPYSASGGALDVDDTNGYGPENIYWPTGAAPTGTYNVDLDYYSGSGTANFTILVQAFGRTRRFEGSIVPGQTLRICSFSDQALLGTQAPQPLTVRKEFKVKKSMIPNMTRIGRN